MSRRRLPGPVLLLVLGALVAAFFAAQAVPGALLLTALLDR
jgi:hypothetical protein